jgi:hypothetical protein
VSGKATSPAAIAAEIIIPRMGMGVSRLNPARQDQQTYPTREKAAYSVSREQDSAKEIRPRPLAMRVFSSSGDAVPEGWCRGPMDPGRSAFTASSGVRRPFACALYSMIAGN